MKLIVLGKGWKTIGVLKGEEKTRLTLKYITVSKKDTGIYSYFKTTAEFCIISRALKSDDNC
jgi:hypothetical protein